MLNLGLRNVVGSRPPAIAPPIPTDVVITVVSDTAFSIAYVSAKPVEIWYSTDNVTYTKHGDSDATPYAMTGLTAGTEYWVKARAVNGSKYSEFTAASNATTLDISGINLTGRYYQVVEGGDLIDYLGGVSIPYISGSDLEQLFDFSVLEDERFDKSTWGTLDSYFYYDSEHPYFSKLKDFHYKKLNTQITFDDQIFLKASATTNVSNILTSIDELLIYSVTQVTTNLSKLKTYIGIQDAFNGDELIINTTFLDTSETVEYDTNSIYTVADGKGTLEKGTATTVVIAFEITENILTGQVVSILTTMLENPNTNTYKIGIMNNSWVGVHSEFTTTGLKSFNLIATSEFTRFYVRLSTYSAGSKLVFNNISCKLYYENYYAAYAPESLNITIERATEYTTFTSDLAAHNGIYRAIIDSNYKIRYSNNSGLTYGSEYDFTSDLTNITNINKNLIRITNDGNVLVFVPKERRVLISTDGCETFNDVVFYDSSDNILALHTPANANYPGEYFRFMEGFEIAEINDVEIIVFGNYTNSGLGASPVYLYYSIDGGITFKVFYEFGQNANFTDDGTDTGGTGGTLLGDAGNPIVTRHIHSVDFSNGKFMVCTGDNENENWFMECNYNTVTDAWTVSFLNDTTVQRYRALGLYQDNSYYYWGSDGSGETGLYKCLKSDINITTNHIKMTDPADSCYGFKKIDNYILAVMQSGQIVYISNDSGRSYYYAVDLSEYIAISGVVNYIIKDNTNKLFSIKDNSLNRILISLPSD